MRTFPDIPVVDPTRVTPSQEMEAYALARGAYWEDYAQNSKRWVRARQYYQERLLEIYSLGVSRDLSILELGCGEGDLLAALRPRYGHGIDLPNPSLLGPERNTQI